MYLFLLKIIVSSESCSFSQNNECNLINVLILCTLLPKCGNMSLVTSDTEHNIWRNRKIIYLLYGNSINFVLIEHEFCRSIFFTLLMPTKILCS